MASSSLSLVAPTVRRRAVVQQDLQLFDVVDRLAGEQGMRAAGVVADHAAERAAAVRRRIGSERQLMRFGGVAQRIEHHAGLHAREPADRIDLEDPVHVLREVEHHRDVAALAGEAGAGAPRQDRRVELPARRHRRDHIVGIARNDETDGNLTVVRAVGGVQRAAAAIEAHLAADHPLQLPFEVGGLGKRIDRFRVRAERQAARWLAEWAASYESPARASRAPPSRRPLGAARPPAADPSRCR